MDLFYILNFLDVLYTIQGWILLKSNTSCHPNKLILYCQSFSKRFVQRGIWVYSCLH